MCEIAHTASPAYLSDGTSVEPVVDQVLEILAHADLAHQAVLVAVHTSQLAHMREDVLQAVSELEGVDVAKPGLMWTSEFSEGVDVRPMPQAAQNRNYMARNFTPAPSGEA